MRAIVGRVCRLEAALATEIHAHSRASVAEALQRLSDDELELLKSASEANRARRSFTKDERAAMGAYKALVQIR